MRAVERQDWQNWWDAQGSDELKAIFLEAWDPLLVGDSPQAQDEYDDYLAELGTLLSAGGTEPAVAEYLVGCEKQMGLDTSADSLLDVAGRIVSWYRSSAGVAFSSS
jgi:hypothetical protein